MARVNLDIDTQMSKLESEWREAYEASIAARQDYQALAGAKQANAESLDLAHERLDRAEAVKSRIMLKIERLESSIFCTD